MDLLLGWLIVAGVIFVWGATRELRKRRAREEWLQRLRERQEMRARYGLGRARRW